MDPLRGSQLDVVHPLANVDTTVADPRAPVVCIDVFNLNRRPGAVYLAL